MRAALLLLALLVARPAHADDEAPRRRPLHLALGAGGSFLLTGSEGLGRARLDAHLDVLPGGPFGRHGLTAALRHVTPDGEHALATLGVLFEAAAARPRLVITLHADLGTRVREPAAVLGGGIQTHLRLLPRVPLALVLDTTAHLVTRTPRDTHLALASALRISLSF